MAFATPYNMAMTWNFNPLGYTLIGVATAWTIILAGSMFFLVINRHLPFLRIRSIPLAISAVALLHVYWVLCLLAYVLNGNFPCAAEYWIMNINLPLGMALYQATNAQLLHVSALQSQVASVTLSPGGLKLKRASHESWRRPLAKWRSATITKRTITCITVGMTFQLIISTAIFLASRAFHPKWGIVGNPNTDAMSCRQGPEWLPSIIWQIFWAWCYAPYLLWKVRDVHDIHGWRLQTVICCAAGLPATPLWLASLHAKSASFFGHVRLYWISPMWFTPCIFLMEASVVLIPCWHIVKNRQLRKETLSIIAEWEKKRTNNPSVDSGSTEATRRSLGSQKTSLKSASSSRHGAMYTMTALETALSTNPTPLLLFSAFKDFSGENIQFLSSVQKWKRNWNSVARHGLLRKNAPAMLEGDALRRQQFNIAVRIYSSFVSLQFSDYPVNLSSGHYKELEAMFHAPAALCSTLQREDSVTPFNSYWSSNQSKDLESAQDKFSVVSTVSSGSTDTFVTVADSQQVKPNMNLSNHCAKAPSSVEVPETFRSTVFDDAEKSIKYMVLTNTWPKFVAAGYASALEKRSMIESGKEAFLSWIDRRVDQWSSMSVSR